MKGIVFNILEEMVLERAGMEAWNSVLSRARDAGGVYTSAVSYPDDELLALVDAVSEYLAMPVQDVVQAFGEFMFAALARRYPLFIERCPDLFSFLGSIDSVIHVEVNKLYSNPSLPKIDCEYLDEHRLVLHYRSERKMCMLAEGLILGAARHYAVPVRMTHAVCMHRGADHCELEVAIVNE